ncbi:MAG: glycosyltransferase [Candidatus Brennerbacteria bacterium]|nr:glycosyltransferase [Candidatus Brennerbacteria bacterium]
MNNPEVSIIMPTYNRVNFINRAIESVLAQSFGDWEFIIIDDASTDNTPAVLKAWHDKDKRIIYIRNEKNSQPDISKILNQGLALAKGKYIARLDDDDRWCYKDKLKIQVDFLKTNFDYVVCGGGMIVVDSFDRELFRYLKPELDADIRKTALFSNPFSHTTAVFSKKASEKVGGYGNWQYAEDWDLWLKLGQFGKFYNFPLYFTTYIMSLENKSFVYQRPQAGMILSIISKHCRRYPGFYFAFAFNFIQYLYSFLPLFLRRAVHAPLSYVKRAIGGILKDII